MILGSALPRLSGRWKLALLAVAVVGVPTFAGAERATSGTTDEAPAEAAAVPVKRDMRGLLPLGDLRAAPESEASGEQLLRALVTAVQGTESLQSSGDVRVKSVRNGSAKHYAEMVERLAKMSMPRYVQVPKSVYNGSAKHYAETMERPAKKSTQPHFRIVPVPEEIIVGPTEYITRWTFDGVRIRHESRITGYSSSMESPEHADAVYDGARYFCYYPNVSQGRIADVEGSGTSKAYEPWLTLTVTQDRKRLSAILQLPDAKYEGRQAVGGTDCIKASTSSSGLRYEIWISPENGYRAKRIVYSRGQAYTVAEVAAFKKHGSLWFPAGGTYASFRDSASSAEPECTRRVDWTVTSYSPMVPENAFQLQFPVGTRVIDPTGSTFTVGE